MTGQDLLEALSLPTAARIDRRIPKTMLHEHGAPTAANRRQIDEGIDQIKWVAALKPTTIGVAAFRDPTREYLEIAVLHATFRPIAKPARLSELLHRAVPYPLLLVTECGSQLRLSLVHKRWSQGESGKTVLDGDPVEASWGDTREDPWSVPFRSSLALAGQPRGSLLALYQGWIDTVLAWQAARRTGTFTLASSPQAAEIRRLALRECGRLEDEMNRIKSAAAKETQVSRQVEMNLELKRLANAHAASLANM